MARIQLKRGLKADLPSTGLLAGEPLVATDKGELFVATNATTSIPVVPPVASLGAIGTVDNANDLLLIYDLSTTAAKKITVADLLTALAIPADSDKKVAVTSAATPGYLYGTNGTDGVLRVDTSMTMTKDTGSDFVTLSAGILDCGMFGV